MKKYFVTSDIHSFFSEFILSLKNKGFDINNENHIIIICGDLFDRGKESKKLLDFVYDLLLKKRIILIKGNHEILLKNIIKNINIDITDIYNGTAKTLADLQYPHPMSLYDVEMYTYDAVKNYDKKLDFILDSLVNYYELGKYIFVHGWIPDSDEPLSKISDSEWEKATWYNGIEKYFENKVINNKIIVCGHWHTSYGWVRKNNKNIEKEKTINEIKKLEFDENSNFDIFYEPGLIALDACTAFTNKVNILVLEDDDL